MIKIHELAGLTSVLDYYGERGEIIEIDKEVDSECEVAGIIFALNALPKTPGVLFKNVKGYRFPVASCVLSERSRTCEILGLPLSPLEFKEAFIKVSQNLIPPVRVQGGSCKEEICTRDFDAVKIVPSRARASMFGVFTIGCPLAPITLGLCSSDMMMRRLVGFIALHEVPVAAAPNVSAPSRRHALT